MAEISTIAAVIAAGASVLGFLWKVPRDIAGVEKRLADKIDIGDQRLEDKIGAVEERIGNKFDELNRSVGRIEGRLEERSKSSLG